MTSEEFVKGFYDEKNQFVQNCLNQTHHACSNRLFEQLNLSEENKQIFKKGIDSLLTDVFYKILLGMDGEAMIGTWQHNFSIYDESKNNLSVGEIESFAYDYFHGSKH